MIPKIIHYCWFGKSPLPPLVKKCIKSWTQYNPDYKIICWNEHNFNVSIIPYTAQAYKLKKYAFVSDFVRFYLLFYHGGIYLDTDVEVLRSLDIFLNHKMFTGFETKDRVAPGLILGSEKGCSLIKSIMDEYIQKQFLTEKGVIKYENVVTITTKKLLSKGLKLNGNFQLIDEMAIFPVDYFSPKSYFTWETKLTKNTYTIHHYAGSWLPKYTKVEHIFWSKLKMKDRQIIARILHKISYLKNFLFLIL